MQYSFEDKYCNKAEIQSRMTFFALFVLAYEQMVHEWRDMLKDFLVHPFVDEGELQYDTKKANEFNKTYGKATKLFEWFRKSNIITANQQKKLNEIYDKRNKLVHEYPLMTNPIQESDRRLFRDLIKIRKVISRNWAIKIEIPTNPLEMNAVFLDENGNFSPPTNAYSVADILLDIMIETALQKN